MSNATTKQLVLEAMNDLPADATIDDAIERLCFLAKAKRGIEQADAGQTLTHDEARERLLK